MAGEPGTIPAAGGAGGEDPLDLAAYAARPEVQAVARALDCALSPGATLVDSSGGSPFRVDSSVAGFMRVSGIQRAGWFGFAEPAFFAEAGRWLIAHGVEKVVDPYASRGFITHLLGAAGMEVYASDLKPLAATFGSVVSGVDATLPGPWLDAADVPTCLVVSWPDPGTSNNGAATLRLAAEHPNIRYVLVGHEEVGCAMNVDAHELVCLSSYEDREDEHLFTAVEGAPETCTYTSMTHPCFTICEKVR